MELEDKIYNITVMDKFMNMMVTIHSLGDAVRKNFLQFIAHIIMKMYSQVVEEIHYLREA